MRDLTVPQAIVLGSFVIGAFAAGGLFFGLRARAPEVAGPSPPTAFSPPSALPLPPPPASREQVNAEALRALEAQRAALTEVCWRGARRLPSAPPAVKYIFSFSFDAAGHQLARGMTEDASTPSPATTRCVATELQPLQIAPPGAPTSVDVPFQLP